MFETPAALEVIALAGEKPSSVVRCCAGPSLPKLNVQPVLVIRGHYWGACSADAAALTA